MAPIIIGIIFIIFGILLYHDPTPSIYGYSVRPEVGIVIAFFGIIWTIWGIKNIKRSKNK